MSLGQTPFALRADPNQAPKVEQFRADLNVRLTCPDCQDENVQLVEEFGSGDLVCGGCGQSRRALVQQRRADASLSRLSRARAGRQDRRHAFRVYVRSSFLSPLHQSRERGGLRRGFGRGGTLSYSPSQLSGTKLVQRTRGGPWLSHVLQCRGTAHIERASVPFFLRSQGVPSPTRRATTHLVSEDLRILSWTPPTN